MRTTIALLVRGGNPKRRWMGAAATTTKTAAAAAALAMSCRFLASTSTTTTAHALDVVVITGTMRSEGPPRPVLGPRVSQFVVRGLERRGHQVTVIDPRQQQLDFPLFLDKPEFAYARSRVPENLAQTRKVLEKAHAYVAITPEYNHAPSPALCNILNHFGSSVFSYKPSAIVSYSAGQWGGTRAAIALRPILSELGCLPVSAMVHVPKAQQVLDENGIAIETNEQQQQKQQQQHWDGYLDRCLAQLEWWGEACRNHRAAVDPFADSPAFSKDPSERNAPP